MNHSLDKRGLETRPNSLSNHFLILGGGYFGY